MSQPSIEKLDRNFAPLAVEGDVEWFDIRDLGLEGKGFPDTIDPYDRLPARMKGVIRESVWNLSTHSAGMACRFLCDAKIINARWKLRNENRAMNHMCAAGMSGLDLYAYVDNKWRYAGTGVPSETENTRVMGSDLLPGLREYLLYLPLYNGVHSVHIGIPKGSTIARPVPSVAGAGRKPIVFYGTSIVQGGCASRSGMGYPEIIGRNLFRPTVNLGFSGNGPMDIELAQLLPEIDAACYVIDCLPNMNEDMVTARTVPFIQTLHAAKPTTPILVVDTVFSQGNWTRVADPFAPSKKSVLLKAEYAKLMAKGLPFLYYMPGTHLMGDDGLGTVDGIHPTDLGFLRMANAIGEAVGAIIA